VSSTEQDRPNGERPRAIPVVDIGPFLAGADPAPAVATIADACTSVSFLNVTGHGIPAATFDAAYRVVDELLARPEPERAVLASPTGHPFRGLSTQRRADGTPRVHRFQVCHYDDAAAAAAAGVPPEYGDYFAPNVWPEQVAGLREATLTCFAAMRMVGDALMELFARALGLPPDHFAPMLTHPVSDFAVNTYPPRRTPAHAGAGELELTFNEHTDSGMLTVLHQRGDYAGLQVQDLDGTWISVPVRPDALIINIGDLMARWTNDHWPSTRHRVVGSPDPAAARASLATFHLPNVDTVIAPLQPFVGPDGPRYDPVTPFVWEKMFLAKAYRPASGPPRRGEPPKAWPARRR